MLYDGYRTGGRIGDVMFFNLIVAGMELVRTLWVK